MSVTSSKTASESTVDRHDSVNPANGELIRKYSLLSDKALDESIRRASQAFSEWRETTVPRRCELLGQAAILLQQNAEDLARLATAEMGKPLAESRAEVEKCAWVCEYYSQQATAFLSTRKIETDAEQSVIRFDPLGVILAIMPWNFPYWQVFRFAAPVLAAGNVALLKHASNVSGVALAIEELLRDAGFPVGVFGSLMISKEQAAKVIRHPAVRGVSLTGSDRAGREVASVAGESLKKCVLELGGSDPFIVLDDADLELAVDKAVQTRTQNTGQSCIAAKRFIVCEGVADSFIDAFAERMRSLKVGDPLDRETDIGPLARRDLVDALHDQVLRSIDDGAQLLCGGKPVDAYGCYYAPTILDHVRPGMAVFEEETFGPVAAVIRVPNLETAINMANQSRYGLGASIWSRDTHLARRVAISLECGCISINEIVKSDPRLPFGGVKDSGYGRELSDFGIREFVNVKSIW